MSGVRRTDRPPGRRRLHPDARRRGNPALRDALVTVLM